MRRTLFTLVTLAWLIGTYPISAQDTVAVQKPSASCDALLQHSLAWWLSSTPTVADRDQLTGCMAGSAPACVVEGQTLQMISQGIK